MTAARRSNGCRGTASTCRWARTRTSRGGSRGRTSPAAAARFGGVLGTAITQFVAGGAHVEVGAPGPPPSRRPPPAGSSSRWSPTRRRRPATCRRPGRSRSRCSRTRTGASSACRSSAARGRPSGSTPPAAALWFGARLGDVAGMDLVVRPAVLPGLGPGADRLPPPRRPARVTIWQRSGRRLGGAGCLRTGTWKDSGMPIATPEVYAEMLDRAKARLLRLPGHQRDVVADAERGDPRLRRRRAATASSRSPPAAPSTCPARRVKDMVTGSVALAAFAHEVAKKYPVNIALHTDHCPKDKLDGFVRPLLAISAERVAAGGPPLFQSHMWDGSAVPLEENLEIAAELLDRRRRRARRPRDRDRRRRRRGGRRRRRDQREALHDPGGRARDRRGARPRRERPLPHRADLRQRARRLQARQRQAAPGDPQGDPGRGRRQVRHRTQAVRPRLPRRLGLAARGDQRGASTTASSR